MINMEKTLKHCTKCGNVLDALHMGDIEPDICIECEIKIIQSIDTLPEEPMILWERL